jgi:RNA polymerase sigma-70 factor (ECF subfamily)
MTVEEQELGIGAASRSVDESALVERFWERIRLFACRRLATTAEGEDVAQETIRRVLEALRQGRLRAPEALPAFVFETARNVCRQRQRSAMREGRAFDRLRGWLSHMDAVADPLANILSESERVAVRAALARLAADDREVLSMSYYHALDTAEVARRLGSTPGAIRVRRYRALHRLRELLGNHR